MADHPIGRYQRLFADLDFNFQWHLVNFKGQFCHEPLLNPDPDKDTYKSIHGKLKLQTRNLCATPEPLV